MDSSIRASTTNSAVPSVRPRARRLRRMLSRPRAAVGIGLSTLLVALALLAPIVAPHDPLAQARGDELASPSLRFPFGTDELGRDILSRVLFGARISLMVALLSVLIASVVGVLIGLVGGYFGGRWDAVIMRLTDTILAFPAILLAMAIVSLLGPSSLNAMLAVAIVSIPTYARLSRSSVLAEREREYVEASRAMGAADRRIIFRTILPNTLTPVVIQITISMGYAVLLEAGLSFLGLGTQPPAPSWGAMLFSSSSYLHQAPWYGLYPGVFLTVLILGLNFISEGVQEVYSPQA